MHPKSEHPDPPLENLILNGEGPNLEFKETFSLDTKTNKKKSDEIRYAALREICGFLNTRDETLIIGVSDSMEIVGIQKDGYDGNFDKYSLVITEIIANSLGALAASLVKIDLEMVEKNQFASFVAQKVQDQSIVHLKEKKKKFLSVMDQ
jgi:predicted HTH transcriptional regulator